LLLALLSVEILMMLSGCRMQ